jgi:hypothetical protein
MAKLGESLELSFAPHRAPKVTDQTSTVIDDLCCGRLIDRKQKRSRVKHGLDANLMQRCLLGDRSKK